MWNRSFRVVKQAPATQVDARNGRRSGMGDELPELPKLLDSLLGRIAGNDGGVDAPIEMPRGSSRDEDLPRPGLRRRRLDRRPSALVAANSRSTILPSPSVRSAMMWVGRDHFEHRQFGDRRRAWAWRSSAPGPVTGALELNVLQIIFDQLANAWTAVRMGDDLEQEVGRGERGQHRRRIGRLVLVTHGASRNPHGPIVEGAHQRVDLGAKRRLREFLREAPYLTPSGDRSLKVEKHAMGVPALAAA